VRTPHPVKPGALDAWVALLACLLSLTDRGQSTPCLRDPGPFTSDDRHERAEAAVSCSYCPVLTHCRAYADAQAETWHVWAGVDRTPTTRAKGTA
jgi:hypothetical protein